MLGVRRRLIVVLVEQRKFRADRIDERQGEPEVVAQQVLSREVVDCWEVVDPPISVRTVRQVVAGEGAEGDGEVVAVGGRVGSGRGW